MVASLRGAAARAARAVPPVRHLLDDRGSRRAEVARLTEEVAQLRAELGNRAGDVPQSAEFGENPPGHFHSTIPDMADIWARKDTVWAERTEVPGIDVRAEDQLALVGKLAALSREHPWTEGSRLRYRFDNHMIATGDALVLYGMLRLHQPRRVVEVGSGFSSALMLDTDDTHFGGSTRFTFIDPYPDRLNGLLSDADRERATVIEDRAELLDPTVFTGLSAGDLLFIDSSHVSRIGSDVNHLFLELLPQLPAGVLVHIHDIPWPFEYWPRWVAQGRYWNEAYLLRALLVGNPGLRILWFSSYMERVHREVLDAQWPEFRAGDDAGASMWMITA